MTTSVSPINDVNLAVVAALSNAVQASPQAAQTTWKADVEWTGAFTSQVRVRDFAPYESDEPAALGGGDSAPNPVEQLLGALGSCLRSATPPRHRPKAS
jgi:organic hydroperoxide reductase OsmC/OhrA